MRSLGQTFLAYLGGYTGNHREVKSSAEEDCMSPSRPSDLASSTMNFRCISALFLWIHSPEALRSKSLKKKKKLNSTNAYY